MIDSHVHFTSFATGLRELRESLDEGWQPLGPMVPFVISGTEGNGLLLYTQTLVKYEEQHEELARLRGLEARAKMMLGELDSQRGIISDDDLVEYTKEQMRLVLGVE